MSQYTNRRRRAVSTINPHQNAEGNIVLRFSGLALHEVLGEDFKNSRNDLNTRKAKAINLDNGNTIAILAQCKLRDKLIDAAVAAEEGKTVMIKRLVGNRCAPDGKTGMVTVFATELELVIAPEKKQPLPIVKQVERLAEESLPGFLMDGTEAFHQSTLAS